MREGGDIKKKPSTKMKDEKCSEEEGLARGDSFKGDGDGDGSEPGTSSEVFRRRKSSGTCA